MKKANTIEETLTTLEELVLAQDKALKTADSLLTLKDCIIDLLEEQKKLQAKRINVLNYCFYALVAFNVISFVIAYFHAS